MKTIAEKLVNGVSWGDFQVVDGQASNVADAIRELLDAKDASAAESAYWKLENRVVVQGTIYSAAVPVTQILVASLIDERPTCVRIAILDLLFQILTGSSADDLRKFEIDCKILVTQGFWLIVKEFVYGSREVARDVLNLLGVGIDYDSMLSSDE